MKHPRGHGHVCARCRQPFTCHGEMVAVENADGRAIPICQAFYVRGIDICDHCYEHVYGDADRRREGAK